MIKANELRIGNKVLQLGEYLTICSMDIDIIENDRTDHITKEDYEPIPLTMEILQKCGFVTTNGIVYSHTEIDFSYDKTDWRLWTGKLGGVGFKKGTCRYLHQLQNLFFALTGEELEINLTELQLAS